MVFASADSRCRKSFTNNRVVIVCCLLVVFMITGCGRKKIRVPPTPTPVVGATETGIASWYGHPYHGRRAANGEVYDMKKLTAAHRTLPFDTWVRVQNLSNGKRVDVRINDRGPFVRGRIIDLSRAAARRIEMIGPGTVRVRIEIIDRPKNARTVNHYAVQVGAFGDREKASRLRSVMENEFGFAELERRDGDPPMWRVRVGRELTYDAAAGLAERLRSRTGEAFVVLAHGGRAR